MVERLYVLVDGMSVVEIERYRIRDTLVGGVVKSGVESFRGGFGGFCKICLCPGSTDPRTRAAARLQGKRLSVATTGLVELTQHAGIMGGRRSFPTLFFHSNQDPTYYQPHKSATETP